MALSGNRPVGRGQFANVFLPLLSLPAKNIHWYDGEMVGISLDTGIAAPLVPGLVPRGYTVGELDLSEDASPGDSSIDIRCGIIVVVQDNSFGAGAPFDHPVFWDPATNKATDSDLNGTAAYLGKLIRRQSADAIEVAIIPEQQSAIGMHIEVARLVTHADFTAAAVEESIDLQDEPLPPYARFLGASLGETFTAFSGGTVSAAVIDIGGTDLDGIVTNLNVFTGATGFPKAHSGAAGTEGTPYVVQFGGQTPTLTMQTTDGNVAALDAGQISVRLFFVVLP
ncbi:MAG: hypothetical protein IPM54_25010 [Polyangiaceae bacterium]|nr:hypothetical protein [Polyangiaceae bacterium]